MRADDGEGQEFGVQGVSVGGGSVQQRDELVRRGGDGGGAQAVTGLEYLLLDFVGGFSQNTIVKACPGCREIFCVFEE